VAAGFETLLRLEERFEVKRLTRLADTPPLLLGWQPDVALVDGVLLQDGERPQLGIPWLVLSGSAVDGEGLVRWLEGAKGWLRKDATAAELCAAVDRALDRPRPAASAQIARIAALVVGALLAWGYLALRSSG
jgi:hypothetical protein